MCINISRLFRQNKNIFSLPWLKEIKEEQSDLDKGYKLFYEREDNIKKGLKTHYTTEEARLYFLALDDAFNLARINSGTSK